MFTQLAHIHSDRFNAALNDNTHSARVMQAVQAHMSLDALYAYADKYATQAFLHVCALHAGDVVENAAHVLTVYARALVHAVNESGTTRAYDVHAQLAQNILDAHVQLPSSPDRWEHATRSM